MDQTDSLEQITVNGIAETLQGRSVVALLASKGIEPGGRGVAVAINGAVVPRSAWPHTALQAGDTIEIVQAKQGG
jgi:sulfur carrier protein